MKDASPPVGDRIAVMKQGRLIQMGTPKELLRRPADDYVARSQVDVISAFSTDGRIEAFDLKLLIDDLRVIPPYDAIILAGEDLVRRRPDVFEGLRSLVGAISDVSMRKMNAAVDRDGKSPQEVARQFLESLSDRKENASLPEPAQD